MSRLACLVVLACGGATLVAAPGEASRTVDQAYAVPSDGVLHLTGHGFGHGHGMSQYGAQGAAKQGLTHQQILAFYYPGTTLGTTTGSMRVKLSGATANSLVVQNAAGLRVRSVGSGHVVRRHRHRRHPVAAADVGDQHARSTTTPAPGTTPCAHAAGRRRVLRPGRR